MAAACKKNGGAILVFALLILFTASARAETAPGDACSTLNLIVETGGPETTGVRNVLRCDGTVWQQRQTIDAAGNTGIGTASPQAPLHVAGEAIVSKGTLACAAAQDGALRFTSSTDAWEFCNGSAWVPFDRTPGYFVQTATKWNGNLGGLSGADAKCLTELQTTYDWRGKTGAGTLTSSRVKAFLCDGTTCNNLKPNTVYFFAKANSTTAGGAAFKTDATGAGPGVGNYWDEDAFDSTYENWSSRGVGTAELWSSSPLGSLHCVNWTSASSGQNGRTGNAGNADATRWNEGSYSCNTAMYLICAVNPP